MFKFLRNLGAETRAPELSATQQNFHQVFAEIIGGASSAGVNVTIKNALGVPAVWSAVNFISGTIASLPLHVYETKKGSKSRVDAGLAAILGQAVNDEMSTFDWRKYKFDQVLTHGRGVTYIERNAKGDILNLWPLNTRFLKIERDGLRRRYVYQVPKQRKQTYQASEIIDIPFMLDDDGLSHKSPILSNKEPIGTAIAANAFASRFFKNGGVPPFAVTGNFQTGSAMERAANDMQAAVEKAAKQDRQSLTLPTGLEVKPIGVDAEKSQLIETKRLAIEEVARIYSLPPVFIQDLTHGTFSNTEQQDLHFVKHTLRRWIEQAEQEMNLKLFGRPPANGKRKLFVEFNLDGLLRGDFATRMAGYSQGIQNAVHTPNEVRRRENLPDMPGGDELFIQGATVPVGTQINNGANNEG